MEAITTPLGYVMRFCYNLVSNYAFAIVLFTLFTKVILFPVSLWTHNNSIRLVKIQPQLNFLKAKYYGEKDKISDEQLALYKKEKYHPFAGMIPMIIQVVLLMFVIEIIYNPLTYILHMDSSVISQLINDACAQFNLNAQDNSIQLSVVKEIQNGFQAGGYDLSAVKALNMNFLGFDLAAIPFKSTGKMLLVPVFAGASALLLSVFQSKMNPLQAEQNKGEQAVTSVISVGISLVLGGFVPAGIGFYWICSNLFAMLQQLLLNLTISPKKHIDYDALEKSRQELAKLDSFAKENRSEYNSKNRKRERADYKRFFSVANKHFVIYSEGSGFYRYFEKIIDYILKNSNIVIHYITSDPNDNIFKTAENNQRIRAYYLSSKKMITVFMKMDADIVLMTTPDLENYQYKRSYIRKDIEYIYTLHGCISTHMTSNKGYIDHFDTIFCVNEQHIDEIRKQEELYNLPPKNLVVCGYGFLETLQEKYDAMEIKENDVKKILIAPSWQENNILDSCIDELLNVFLGKGFKVVVRPHPEYSKRYAQRLSSIVERYKDYDGGDLEWELDFSTSESLYSSDILITDWSGVAYEFSYVSLKPCIFIDTPPKIYNPDYEELGIEPIELKLRNEIGKSFAMNNFDTMLEEARNMIENKNDYSDKILSIRNKYIANYGHSGETAGKYIIQRLIEKQKSNNKQ